MNVVENLYEYLKHNDIAEIPGLGTFRLKNISAQINETTGSITPPCCNVVFDRITENNKDFINFMSQREFISFATAEIWIKQYADSLVAKLEKGEQVELPRLGTLKKGYLGEYTFVTDDHLNLMDNVFALEELKNVKIYNRVEGKVDLIHTKQEKHPKLEQQEQFNDVLKEIEEAKPLQEENKINETTEQTAERISLHENAEIDTQASTPVNISEKQESLNIEPPLPQQPVEQEENTEDGTEQKEKDVNTSVPKEDMDSDDSKQEKDDLQQEAMEILSKYRHTEDKTEYVRKKKGVWPLIFGIVLTLLLLCAIFTGAHYMGWLKDVKFLKPITNKLSYYIPVRQKADNPVTSITQIITERQDDEPLEVSPTEVLENEVLDHESVNKPNKTNIIRKNNTTKQKKSDTEEKDNQPAPVVDNSPVLVQSFSKLGFDVIGGTFDTKQKAETSARKAKSLGYDGYVLSKIKNGAPIYYVSYGSRRTLQEANDLMQSMMNKMGGSYYVISR